MKHEHYAQASVSMLGTFQTRTRARHVLTMSDTSQLV